MRDVKLSQLIGLGRLFPQRNLLFYLVLMNLNCSLWGSIFLVRSSCYDRSFRSSIWEIGWCKTAWDAYFSCRWCKHLPVKKRTSKIALGMQEHSFLEFNIPVPNCNNKNLLILSIIYRLLTPDWRNNSCVSFMHSSTSNIVSYSDCFGVLFLMEEPGALHIRQYVWKGTGMFG